MQELVDILKSTIPVKTELTLGGIAGGAGALSAFLFGEWSNSLQALALFIGIDYLTGVFAAWMKPSAEVSSKRGLKGIIKKLALATYVAFGHGLDVYLNQHVFCQLVTLSIISNEGLSIVENLTICGVPVPASIRKKLKQLGQEKETGRKVGG